MDLATLTCGLRVEIDSEERNAGMNNDTLLLLSMLGLILSIVPLAIHNIEASLPLHAWTYPTNEALAECLGKAR